MSFNTTNVTALNAGLPYQSTQGNGSTIPSFGAAASNNLGFGLGKLFRTYVLDPLWNASHTKAEPSPESLLNQRKLKIYRAGLRECALRLEAALITLSQNLKDPGALKKVEQLVRDYALYLEPAEEAHFQDSQQKILRKIEERVTKLAETRIKNNLKELMPIFFLGKSETTQAKSSVQLPNEFRAFFDSTILDPTDIRVSSDIEAAGYVLVNQPGERAPSVDLTALSGTAGYLFYNEQGERAASFNLNALDGTNGFVIPGVATNEHPGYSFSTIDFLSDGTADLVLVANPDSSMSTTYVLFGKAPKASSSPLRPIVLLGVGGLIVFAYSKNRQNGQLIAQQNDPNAQFLQMVE